MTYADNLGWKRGLVATGQADPASLDTYDAERAPVGQAVLRFTNRLFTLAATSNPMARIARTWLVPAVARTTAAALQSTACRRLPHHLGTGHQLPAQHREHR